MVGFKQRRCMESLPHGNVQRGQRWPRSRSSEPFRLLRNVGQLLPNRKRHQREPIN